jgi:hypothetical protein
MSKPKVGEIWQFNAKEFVQQDIIYITRIIDDEYIGIAIDSDDKNLLGEKITWFKPELIRRIQEAE